MWGLKNFTSWKDPRGDKLVRMQVRPWKALVGFMHGGGASL